MNLTCPHCSQTFELTPKAHVQFQGQPHFACPLCQGMMAVPPIPPASTPNRGPQNSASIQKAAMHAQHGMNRNMLVLGVVALLALGGLATFLASRNGGSVFNIFQNTTNQIIHNSYFTQLIANGVTTEKDLKSIGDIRPYGDGFIGVSKEPLAWEQAQDLAKRTGAEVLAIEDSAAGTRQQLTEWLNTTFASYLASTLWIRQDGQTRVLDKRDVMSVTSLDSPRKTTLQWQPNSGRTTTDPTLATKVQPFVNTLGMKFVPVPGAQVLMCVHETRKHDYALFALENPGVNSTWRSQTFGKAKIITADNHPVSGVSWKDAKAFCAWLGRKENLTYRLPTDREWSCAVGVADKEEIGKAPSELSKGVPGVWPWGTTFPPIKPLDNLADKTLRSNGATWAMSEYTDGFPYTAPVMSFPPNPNGIHDMGGNVAEWTEDLFGGTKTDWHSIRGGTFMYGVAEWCRSAHRTTRDSNNARLIDFGFRVVLELAKP